ncbi:MAG: hypothetical protein JKY54_19195 [Flavobacteriales bacterium]|nr:hypothetical protein [Flavobacteriales bacterium]
MKYFVYLLLSISLSLVSFHSYGQDDDYYTTKSDSIAKIKLNNGNVYTGVVLSDNGREIEFQSNEIGKIIITKTDIKKIEYLKSINSNEGLIKEGVAHIGEYGFGQTAFNTPAGQVSFQTHYFAFVDFDFAISDNFSVDVGATIPYLAPLKFGIKGSIDIASNVRIGIKANVFLGIDYWGNSYNSTSFIRVPLAVAGNVVGMITFGDQEKNFTIGGTVAALPVADFTGFGGYIGGFKKIKKKLGLTAELLYGMNQNNTNLFSAGFMVKYFRTPRKIWTFGLQAPFFPQYSYYNPNTGSYTQTLDGYLVIPIPYMGYRIAF